MTRFEETNPAWREILAAAGLTSPAQLLDLDRHPLAGEWRRLCKPALGGRSRWRWTFEHAGRACVAYVKTYRDTPLRTQWDRIQRQSPAHSASWWEYRQADRLAIAGVAAPAPIAVAEEMAGPWERRSAVMLSAAAGEPLDGWIALRAARLEPARKRMLIDALADFVGRFHATGLRHRDLYLCHIFIAWAGPGAPHLCLIDLARIFRPLSFRQGRWTVKDLAQLDSSACVAGATQTDRLRFLRMYCARMNIAAWRRLAGQVSRKSDSILRRETRKSRSSPASRVPAAAPSRI